MKNYDVMGRRIEDAKRSLNMEKQRLANLKRQYAKMPKGSIIIKKKKGKISYYLYEDKKETSIKRKDPIADKLIYKRVLEHKIKTQELYCKTMSEALEKLVTDTGNLSRTLTRIYETDGAERFFMTPESYKWMKQQYRQNTYKAEQKKYITGRGTAVRSKSEWIIAGKLEEQGIPYRYEAELRVGNHTYYPDFMVMRSDGSIVLWEHLGLMDVEGYRARALEKIENYRKSGYVQHSNLICTYENDIENRQVLDEIIRRFI